MAVTITPTQFPPMTVGQAVSVQLIAKGGKPPHRFRVTLGAWPDGVTMSSSGLVSGTPTKDGQWRVDVQAQDSRETQTGTIHYTGTVAAQPPAGELEIGPPTLPPMTVGTAYSAQFTATGGTTPYTFSTTGQPPGLTLSPDGVLSGTPTTAGAFIFAVEVKDAAAATASKTYSVSVAEATTPPPPMGDPPTITTQPVSVTVEWGQQAMLSVNATGTAPLAYQWFLGVNPMSGQTNPVLLYTPTTSGQVLCRVTNAAGTVTSNTVTVGVKMPVSPPAQGVGLAYRRAIRVPSMWASFAYGDCTGRVNERGNLNIIFTGDQVNQGSPIYELEITDAPYATWANIWERPYGGKRGTWMQPSAVAADIEKLHGIVRTLSEGDPDEQGKLYKKYGTDVSLQLAGNAAVINARMLNGASQKGRAATSSEPSYVDFDNQTDGYVPIANGAHFWHPEANLLYVCYADTYNVTSRPDCGILAVRLLPDGKTETFGPWRFKTVTKDGNTRLGPKAAGGPHPHPVTGKMLVAGSMGSGNATCPWGSNLQGGADWPTESTPTHQTLDTNLECLDNYLYSYPMIGQFTNGVPNGPIKSQRRRLHPALSCAYEGQPDENHADPLKNNGVGSWTDGCGQAGFVPLPDRVIFLSSVAGSPIQDPTNPQAAHIWYSTALNNPPYTCIHGIPSPVQITGPVRTAAFPHIGAVPWSVLEQVKRGEIEDWTPEPEEVNAEAQWGVQTAEIWDIGGAKGLYAGPVHDGKLYLIAQHADTTSYPGISVPIIHEFELVG